MHIDSTPHGPHLRHRHWVAAPLLCLFATLPFFFDQSVVRASLAPLLDQGGGNATVMYPEKGMRGQLMEGSLAEGTTEIRLSEGALLLDTQGRGEVAAGEARLIALRGSFFTAIHGSTLSVAALTSPVIVRLSQGRVLIPAGMQWRDDGSGTAHHLQPLPAGFLREKLALLQQMPPLPVESADVPSKLRSLPFQLEQAHRDAVSHWAQQTLTAAGTLAQEGKIADAQALLADADLQDALQDPLFRESIARVVGQAADPRPLKSLLPFLFQDIDLWLLASVHPDLREMTWLLPSPDISPATLFQRLKALPLSDADDHALSPLLVDKWQQDSRDFLLVAADAGERYGQLLEALEPFLSRLAALGYPERLQRYTAAIVSLLPIPEDKLTSDARTALASVRSHLSTPVVGTSIVTAQSSSAESSAAPRIDRDFGEASVRALLQNGDAAFTVDTTVTSLPSGNVAVHGILFSGPTAGDHLYDFEMDPRWNVSRISRDGEEESPFPLSWEDFLHWVKS